MRCLYVQEFDSGEANSVCRSLLVDFFCWPNTYCVAFILAKQVTDGVGDAQRRVPRGAKRRVSIRCRAERARSAGGCESRSGWQVAIMCTHAQAACDVWSAGGTNTVTVLSEKVKSFPEKLRFSIRQMLGHDKYSHGMNNRIYKDFC